VHSEKGFGRTLIMKSLTKVLCETLAISVVSLLVFGRLVPEKQDVEPAFPQVDLTIPELSTADLMVIPMPDLQIQAVEEPVPEVHPISVEPTVVQAVPEPAAAQHPVQMIEQRGDAMLFEAQALLDTPFDQAIVMPFEAF
jgi:hypothetical protein